MRAVLLAVLLLAVPALAVDFAGEWRGAALTNGEKQDFYFVFWEDGDTLNGSGGQDLSDQDVIQNGKIDGDKISFDLSPGANTMFHFELCADGTALKGTVHLKKDDKTLSGTVSLKKDKL